MCVFAGELPPTLGAVLEEVFATLGMRSQGIAAWWQANGHSHHGHLSLWAALATVAISKQLTGLLS